MNSKSVFFIIASLCGKKRISFLIMKNAVSDDDMLIVVYSPFAPNKNAFPISYPVKRPILVIHSFLPLSAVFSNCRYSPVYTLNVFVAMLSFFFCNHPKYRENRT
ncbi:hypothetical protein CKAH01_16997 [Colletotrichum kahawae]|uniref:Uncharacterized protein n=1 Tax=Colletotrichum kahawae TaxID=34407 RepID=A0AAD9YEV4_COLKA|nr:hypothetical protein CKAH01_16997 [Colletotrichum kahawae]